MKKLVLAVGLVVFTTAWAQAATCSDLVMAVVVGKDGPYNKWAANQMLQFYRKRISANLPVYPLDAASAQHLGEAVGNACVSNPNASYEGTVNSILLTMADTMGKSQ